MRDDGGRPMFWYSAVVLTTVLAVLVVGFARSRYQLIIPSLSRDMVHGAGDAGRRRPIGRRAGRRGRSDAPVARALADVRYLTLPNGAAVAGRPGPWRYVWPRDASFVAAAYCAPVTGRRARGARVPGPGPAGHGPVRRPLPPGRLRSGRRRAQAAARRVRLGAVGGRLLRRPRRRTRARRASDDGRARGGRGPGGGVADGEAVGGPDRRRVGRRRPAEHLPPTTGNGTSPGRPWAPWHRCWPGCGQPPVSRTGSGTVTRRAAGVPPHERLKRAIDRPSGPGATRGPTPAGRTASSLCSDRRSRRLAR